MPRIVRGFLPCYFNAKDIVTRLTGKTGFDENNQYKMKLTVAKNRHSFVKTVKINWKITAD